MFGGERGEIALDRVVDLGPAAADGALMGDGVVEQLEERAELRLAFDERDEQHRHGGLEPRDLEELLAEPVRVGALADVEHEPHAAAVGEVLDVGDAAGVARTRGISDHVGDVPDHPVLATLGDTERQLADHDLIAALRNNPAYQATPILVLTTESGEPFKEAARAAGATGWIEKPLDPDMLTELVAALAVPGVV